MNYLYVVKAYSDNGKGIMLTRYVGRTRSEVESQVLSRAREQDNKVGKIDVLLEKLNWRIIKVELVEVSD